MEKVIWSVLIILALLAWCPIRWAFSACDPALYRRDRGLWIIRELTRVWFGGRETLPIPADYNGWAGSEIGVFQPATGLWAVRGLTRVYFGGEGDIPLCSPR